MNAISAVAHAVVQAFPHQATMETTPRCFIVQTGWTCAALFYSYMSATSCMQEKLRVKAFYRRALALEALQRLEDAEKDINLALKVGVKQVG